MLVDLVGEVEAAIAGVVQILEDLHDPTFETKMVAVTVSDLMGARGDIGGAAHGSRPRTEWVSFYDLDRVSEVWHEFQKDYWFDNVEMDESRSVWVDVAMPDGTTRRVDVEADHDLGNALLDFLEFIVGDEKAQRALGQVLQGQETCVLLNVGDGGQQRVLKSEASR